MDNLGRNTDLDNAIGKFTSFGNNMPAGYLKFMDIFGYLKLISGIEIYKVVEVKTKPCNFPDDLNQLLRYIEWVVENIASGDHKSVEGVLITHGFDKDIINFVENYNSLGRKIRLIKFDYLPPLYKDLSSERVI